ncbi:hypothetical protein OTU49_006827 [Cherax quadricarinatus]|uniref:AAA+ ATPase domain-containing protein n=1 Tax=Cherax quadricarinatus TaxID=27406 RepID=A0AAW0WY80_CHEQU
MNVEHKHDKDKVQKMSLGQKTNRPTKVILLVGATGTGKTTLINAMVNYIYQVDFTDNFRLVVTDNKNAPKTDLITAYAFYQLPGIPFEYNYVLIDTPGFGDTRGIQRDRDVMKQLEMFLKQDYGIDQVDGVCFVTPASAAILTQTQRRKNGLEAGERAVEAGELGAVTGGGGAVAGVCRVTVRHPSAPTITKTHRLLTDYSPTTLRLLSDYYPTTHSSVTWSSLYHYEFSN